MSHFEKIANLDMTCGIKKINNSYNFYFRPKPPHVSLKNSIFVARMRGFWPKVKIVGVIEFFYAALIS